MQFYIRKRRNPAINVVSLIDILAILLIFFIVTTTFRKSQQQLQINLPESKSAETAPASSKPPAVLRVQSASAVSLDDKPVTLEGLEGALRSWQASNPGRPLALQADREAPFGVVVRVLDALRACGLRDIPAFTEPES